MSLTINHNLMAINTARNLSTHYGSLGVSTRRLSSGLRIGTAADDAAGLAVREIMRADIASLGQGIRNANDAISMIQVADGALQVIDEKLIRMKELATQAATGTYNTEQRKIINEEFQSMAMEIERISKATDFNGIKLLDGSLNIVNNSENSPLNNGMVVHFGTGNEQKEDYYNISIDNCGLSGLNLATSTPSNIERINNIAPNGEWVTGLTSGVVPYAYIPRGTKNLTIQLDSHGGNIFDLSWDDDIAIFTRNGVHLVGRPVGPNPPSTDPASNDYVWSANGINIDNVNSSFITAQNGFTSNATYNSENINIGGPYSPTSGSFTTSYNGMNISSGGDGNWNDSTPNDRDVDPGFSIDYVHFDNVTEDLLLFSVGSATFAMNVSWGEMSEISYSTINDLQVINISTQESAQYALNSLTDAIIYKDKIRASLGATQNRLENTITNLQIQAENLQAAESRISDADMAKEMTEFVKSQILTQSATAMLAQANTLPEMALQLIQGQQS